MEHAAETFRTLLREKMAELDADEAACALAADDPIERLGLEAQQTILATDGTPLPRGGHQAYIHPPTEPQAPGSRQLNLLH